MTSTSSAGSWLSTALLLLALLSLAGCGSAPVRAPQQPGQVSQDYEQAGPGVRAVQVAYAQLGTPYRYGGSSPDGFDCSGLVQYSYNAAGVTVPRTTSQQLRHTRPVPLSDLQPGDLLFFRLSWAKTSHVGIYAGNGLFIHAPSSGKQVSYAELDNPFWRERIVAAGRVER